MRILLLLTDLFDTEGGIQTFKRSMVKALGELAAKNDWQVEALVLNDNGHSGIAEKYFHQDRLRYTCFRRDKWKFCLSAVKRAAKASIIFIGHVNFVPLALPLRVLNPQAKILLAAYGLDVWQKLPALKASGVKRADCILSISNHTKMRMMEANAVESARFAILPCTLEPDFGKKPRPDAEKNLPLPDGQMVLSVSRLNSEENYKGIDLMIAAMPEVLRQAPDAFYVVVGDGNDRHRLEELAEKYRVRERVHFAGRVTDEELSSYYRDCEVFALPSSKEGFGIVFLEAMYYAKPCIGLRAGAIPEVVEEAETGLLAEPGNVLTLVNALSRLLKDEALRRRMGERGRQRLAQEFSFDAFQNRLEVLLYD